jgi:NAD(P)-dependent dehydrogenase (short-subunit alcohol dehydrogenase family)
VLADLTGKTALVTGGGRGIGRGIAVVLTDQGARVAVTDRKLEWAEATAAELGDHAIALELDVTDQASVDTAATAVLARWDKLDILVNNAGVPADPHRPAGRDREEDWDRTFAVNVKGVVRCCEAFVPSMRQRGYGKIINIGSMAAHAARRTAGPYAASKAALLRYTKGLAVSLAPDRINVNAICPGAVWTPFQQADTAALQRHTPELATLDPYEAFQRAYRDIIPLGRPQTPEDIGKVAAFLGSDDARNITGQCIHVDGGAILRD